MRGSALQLRTSRVQRIAAATLFVVAGLTASAAAPVGTSHPSGLEIVPPLDYSAIAQEGQMFGPLAMAVNDAWDLAEQEPANFGYPYADRATGSLILTPTGPTAEARASQWLPRPQAAAVRRTAQRVNRSYGQLETIRHAAIGPGVTDLPDGNLIWQTTPDVQGNRVIIVVDRISDALLFALASRYGTQAIVIRVVKNPGVHNLGRQNDISPFAGAAAIDIPVSNQACSSAFAFMLSGYHRMLSAGHCAPDGGYVWSRSDPVQQYGMGYIYAGDQFENWNTTGGTTILNGLYHGDMSMVTLDLDRQGSPWLYRGDAANGYKAPVMEMWSVAPEVGDQFCTSGRSTGELCGWVVNTKLTDVLVVGGAVNKNVSIGNRSGCALAGDSGGAVYTVRPADGGIAAKGVMNQTFGSSPCDLVFTDVRRAAQAWPGMTLDIQ